jgi:hypothetical protein
MDQGHTPTTPVGQHVPPGVQITHAPGASCAFPHASAVQHTVSEDDCVPHGGSSEHDPVTLQQRAGPSSGASTALASLVGFSSGASRVEASAPPSPWKASAVPAESPEGASLDVASLPASLDDAENELPPHAAARVATIPRTDARICWPSMRFGLASRHHAGPSSAMTTGRADAPTRGRRALVAFDAIDRVEDVA